MSILDNIRISNFGLTYFRKPLLFWPVIQYHSILQLVAHRIRLKCIMRGPGIEPGPQHWQCRILTTILPALNSYGQNGFIKVYF